MYRDNQRGFTLLELTVVILVSSVVGVVALNYYYKLMVDIESTTVERDLSAVRSAIGLQIAAHYAAGKMAELENWTGGNPVELLVEPPGNYRGVIAGLGSQLKTGSWYFDKSRGVLLYLVRNRFYFESELDDPARAEFQLEALFGERRQGGPDSYVSGLRLNTLSSYRWGSPWDRE
jgi:prepilin-type N-terminal cleavage/methylation domain-containing protein